MRDILKYPKSKDDIKNIQEYLRIEDYYDFYDVVMNLCNEGLLVPVKSSGFNGKSKPLYKRYYIRKPSEDFSCYINELKNELHPLLDTRYYLNNIEKYVEDREYVIKLSNYFKYNFDDLKYPASENERSFAIWQREKFLKDKGGRVVLNRLGIDISVLNFYKTPQPFVYYSSDNNESKNILVLENKDTYYTIRKIMIEGKSNFFGIDFSTVMYGAGKLILSKQGVEDFLLYSEEWIKGEESVFYYLGDIDYEGFMMYENLKHTMESSQMNMNIKLFTEAMNIMVDRGRPIKDNLPVMKSGQNKSIKHLYRDELSNEYSEFIDEILNENKYIPQEILTYKCFREN